LTRTLAEWLAHCERVHPKTIELTLDRIATVKARLGLALAVPTIVVAGPTARARRARCSKASRSPPATASACTRSRTSSTSRSAAGSAARASTASCCCRTSRRSSARAGDVTLTYFEFTLLAIVSLFAATPLDLVILEVGLGGRLDAVNAFDNDCAIVTSIDIDHSEYLGPDRESIGREKAGVTARRQARDRERPAAAAERHRRSDADRRRPLARRPRLSRRRRSPAVELVGPCDAARAASAIRRCAAPTSCSTPPERSRRSRRCASGCP
jgi:dihydrofolate synthase/folylpolyglutamate synthase